MKTLTVTLSWWDRMRRSVGGAVGASKPQQAGNRDLPSPGVTDPTSCQPAHTHTTTYTQSHNHTITHSSTYIVCVRKIKKRDRGREGERDSEREEQPNSISKIGRASCRERV